MIKGEMVKYEKVVPSSPYAWSNELKLQKLQEQLDTDMMEGFCIGARVTRTIGVNTEGTIVDVEDKPVQSAFNYQGLVTPYKIKWDNNCCTSFLYGSHELSLTGEYVSVETSTK